MLKSITPHLPSLPRWRSDTSTSVRLSASYFVGFRADTSEIGGAGAGAVGMCACFVRSWNQNLSASCFSWLMLFILQVLRCITRIQQCTTVPSSALWHIGTVFSNVIALRLSEKLFCEIHKGLVRNFENLGISWNIDVSVESKVALSCWSGIRPRS